MTYAVVLAILVVASVLVTVFAARAGGSVRRRGEVLAPASVESARLLAALVDQETGARGYALQARDDFLQPFTTGRAAERAALDRLRTLLTSEPGQQRRLGAVEAAAQQWRGDYAEPLIAAARAGGPAAAGAFQADLGKVRFDAVRGRAAELDRSLERETALAGDSIARALRNLVVVLVLAVVGLLLLLVLLAWAARSWVTRPLLVVGEDVRVVAGGDLWHEVHSGGPPDIASVAADVESMRLQLLAELEVARLARADLQESSAQLELQAEDLRRSNRDLEQFAYVASHDLQEPLRKVASFCQMLERRYDDQLDERGRTYIAFAVDGAKRMQALIGDLLAFSRVGRGTEDFTDVPFGDALSRALAALATAVEQTGARVTADPLPVVRGDATLLAQLLQNLVGNALKFAGEQRPRVHLSARSVPAPSAGQEWEVTCRDEGIGIDPDYAEKIFVIFQRLHGRESYAGTGIGLALCRKIVEFHGGRIWLDTSVHAGAAFRFTLPVLVPDVALVRVAAGAPDPDLALAGDPA